MPDFLAVLRVYAKRCKERARPTRNVAATFGSKWRASRGNNNLCMRCGSSMAMLVRGVFEGGTKGGYAPQKPQNVSPCCCNCWQRAKKWIWAADAAASAATGKRKLWPVPPANPSIASSIQENHTAPNALKDLWSGRRLSRANLPTLPLF